MCPLPHSRSRLQLPQTSDTGRGLRVTPSGAAPRTRGCPPVLGEGERESKYENARLLGQEEPACSEQVRCHRSTCEQASRYAALGRLRGLAHQRRRRHRGWKRVCVERTTGAECGVRSCAQRVGRARRSLQHLPPPRPLQGSPTDGGWVKHFQPLRARSHAGVAETQSCLVKQNSDNYWNHGCWLIMHQAFVLGINGLKVGL